LFSRPLSKLDQLILLKYLSRDKKEIVCSPTVDTFVSLLMQTIKFRISDITLTPITTSDAAIAQLKTVQLSLTGQIDLLTSQCEKFTEKAREATSKQNRIVALSALKSRKLTELALQKRSDAFARIEEVLNGVGQAASDKEIIKTLEGGAKALERLNKDIGGIERVERIMERIREGIEESDDVGRAIAEMGSAKVDESEVQEEFDIMLKAEEQRNIERQLEEKAKGEAEEKAQLERTEALVEELKSVSLETPGDIEGKTVEEALPG
jgi:charged multivesicular body protein 7